MSDVKVPDEVAEEVAERLHTYIQETSEGVAKHLDLPPLTSEQIDKEEQQ